MINKELFLENTQALFEINQPLAYELRCLKELDFDFVKGLKTLDVNIKDELKNCLVYKDALLDQEEKLKEIYPKFSLYPVLFLYGIGNGLLLKKILEEKRHERIILFESKIQILAMAFHLFDFSVEIRAYRLIIFNANQMQLQELSTLFSIDGINTLSKTYELIIHNEYYEKDQKILLKINDMVSEAIIEEGKFHGLSPSDALVGVENLCENLATQLKLASYQSLLNNRKGKNNSAIIVSSGPSLTKQLPLLKKYQDKASIFCADSAYPILMKYDIKPDYVLCLEKDEKAKQFFQKSKKDFDKDILFVCLSVTNPKVIKALKNKNLVIYNKNSAFTRSLHMKNYGFFNVSLSVAHLGLELIFDLKFKSVVLIGQDLAYGEDGRAHAKDYISENKCELSDKPMLVQAYGGKKGDKVYTKRTWVLFKTVLERMIRDNRYLAIPIFDATEGGAKIQGVIERDFKSICEKQLKKESDKIIFLRPRKPSKAQYILNLKKALENIQIVLSSAKRLIERADSLKERINEEIELEKLDFEKLEALSKEITEYKLIFNLDNGCKEILKPILYNLECEQAIIMVSYAKDYKEQKEKLIIWIKSQLKWLFEVSSYLHLFHERLEKNPSILKLKEKIEQKAQI